MWELDYKEIWVPKNLCFWTVVLEKTLESPLDCKEIQPVSPKGNQSWIYIGRTDAEAESPILWLSDVKNIFIRKDPDVGKEWRQEEKGTTEDEMVGWHHRLDGHEFEQALGVGDGQGSLTCYSPWGLKELDVSDPLNWLTSWTLKKRIVWLCWVLVAKWGIFGWGTCVWAWVLSRVQLFATLWIVARHAPLSVGFFKQEYWSGVPFPPPGDLPDSGMKSGSPVSLAL